MGSPLGWGCSQKSLITRNTTVGMGLPQAGRDTSHTAERRLYPRKAAVHYFNAAPSLLNARAADGMLRPALPPPGHGSFRTILAVGVLVGRSHS